MDSTYHSRIPASKPVTTICVGPAALRVLDALERGGYNPRHSGGRWMARCPAHPDRAPSLSIAEGRDGRALMHCFAGCGLGHVLAVLGLSVADLMGDRPAPRRARSRARVGFGGATSASDARPAELEVRELWASCRPIDVDPEAYAWVSSRRLDPSAVADRGLARALPSVAALPPWARMGRFPWSRSGYRVVVPLHDALGRLVTLHARNVRDAASPKGALPQGCGAAGAVLADSAALLMLRERELPGPLWITEGVPDFLTAATAWGDAADPWPAVLGVLSGSWTPDFAARVPDGAHVVIAVHHDPAGEVYARRITKDLTGRCQLERWTPQGVAQ